MLTSSNDVAHVRADSYVTLHYRIEPLTGPAAGTAFVDTFLDRPATLQLGMGQWAPGLEALLLDQPEGAHFTTDVPAAQAYGNRNPDLLRWISREEMVNNAPPDTEFNPGEMIEFVAPNGGRYAGVLKAIQDDAALFDFNHPLAGIDLQLEVRILGVL
ncbi:FKBP-type peptidyl-prolyl cis-trans isomerase [Castellaniella hirudinis]|uniref:FKBP-type peptidyl-prolyl cis-trans isomerase n=1 Tax=Castellaniella hirudinis TaxID=1144617 RepID=UPI0039C47B27